MSTYLIDEVDAAARTLNDLLDIVCDLQFEIRPGCEDRRVDSLLWIARDLSQGIVDKLDQTNAIIPIGRAQA